MIFWMSSTAIGSTPANGSSSRMKRGRVASARAISQRRRSPPDSDTAGASARCEMDRSSSSASRRFFSVSAVEVLQFEDRLDVLRDRQLAEDRRFLRKVRQPAPRALVDRKVREVLAVELDAAAVGRDETDDHVEAGRLAGAVGAEQADHFAARHFERHVVDHGARLVAFLQARRRELTHGPLIARLPRCAPKAITWPPARVRTTAAGSAARTCRRRPCPGRPCPERRPPWAGTRRARDRCGRRRRSPAPSTRALPP